MAHIGTATTWRELEAPLLPVAEHLNRILNDVLQLPQVRDFAREMGSPSPQAMSLTQAAAFYDREIRLTRSLARMVNPQT